MRGCAHHISLWCCLAVMGMIAVSACGKPKRDNPVDPAVGVGDSGIRLRAALPAAHSNPAAALVSDIRYAVIVEDLADTTYGPMNLVANEAQALVHGVPPGVARVFRVDVFDENRIRTFSASDTVDVTDLAGQTILLSLQRLTGSIELTSHLPPEADSLEVAIVADGDTLRRIFGVEGAAFSGRVEGVPTGSRIQALLTARDADQQMLGQREVLVDVRQELVFRVTMSLETGAVQVVVLFPDYITMAPIDRFSDSAGEFFRRSQTPSLPGPNEAIDFDGQFLRRGFGPNGQRIEFYHFDVSAATPAPLYLLVDRFGEAVPGQLPILDEAPGDSSYSDLRRIWRVQVTGGGYRPNAITSLEAVLEAEMDTTATDQVLNCVVVPDGSTATRRFGAGDRTVLQSGWYRDQIVRYFLFEAPDASVQVAFEGGTVSVPQMYAFLANDEDVDDGFALDAEGSTHNVATRLPIDEGYSPLWALQLLTLDAFGRVEDVPTAQDQERTGEYSLNLLDTEGMVRIVHVNAPIVGVTPRSASD